jgi:MFS family permease
MVAYLFSYVDRQILSMLVGPIRADLGLSDTQVSLLHGLAFAVCYTLLGVWPVGKWADTGNRRNVIAGGVFLWSLMTALCGRAWSYGTLFAARIGVGVGEAALAPSAYSMIADYFPPERRGRALGIFAMGVYFGIGAAVMITGLVVQLVAATPAVTMPVLGEVRSWQLAFLAIGPPGLLVALWLLTVREPLRRGTGGTGGGTGGIGRGTGSGNTIEGSALAGHGTAATPPGFGAVLAHVRAHARFYAALTLGVSLLTLLFNAVAFWVPAHLIRVHGFTPVRIAFTYGPLMFVFGALGIVAGGWLADRLRALGRQDAELRVGVWSALLLWPVAVLAFQVADARLMLALLAPLLFLSSFPFGAASAAIQLVTPNRFRARTSALYLLVINLTGIGFGATAASMVSDYLLHDDRRIGDGVSLVAAIAAPLAALVLASGMRAYRNMQAGAGTVATSGN